MTRTMRDSTTAADIPATGLNLVAGYANGLYTWTAGDWARFPGIPHVTIDVNGSDPRAAVRDWETGDKSGSLEQWVIDHNQADGGKNAVVYCNRSTIPEVRQLTGSQILGKDYYLWVATLDGTKVPAPCPGLPDMTGVVAVQDKGSALTGGHYDESIVYNDLWMASAPPPPADLAGVVVQLPGGGSRRVVSSDNGHTWR